MSVLFLDIDGVLNTEQSLIDSKDNNVILPELVENLNLILEACRPKIVISSSWRFFNKFPDTLIEHNVFDAKELYLDHTTFESKDTRGLEIKQWISDNKHEGIFAIIDDFEEMEDLAKKWFLTSFKYGLTKEIAEEVIDHLGYYESFEKTNILCFECGQNYGTNCPGRKENESTRCESCFEKYMHQIHLDEERHLSQFPVCTLCSGNKRVKTDKGSERCKKCDGIGVEVK